MTLFRTTIAGLLLLATGVSLAQAERITWRKHFEVAMEEAWVLRRPMMVYFQTNWCGYCRKLEAQTFRNQEFVKASSRMVPVKVNGDQQRDLAALFRVKGYPTTVFLDRRGKEIGRVYGYRGPEDFRRMVDLTMGKREPFDKVRQDVAANPEDLERLFILGDTYMALGRYDDAATVFKDMKRLDPENKSELVDDAQLDLSLACYLAGDVVGSLKLFESYLSQYENGDRRDLGLYFYGMALMDAGKATQANEVLGEAESITQLAYIREQVQRLRGE